MVPEDGMQVLCRGYVDVYPQRGTFQLIARSMQPIGEGQLQAAFRKLHNRLKSEGLFDAALKKQIPSFPRRIAVITSPTGAAIHDFLQVATRRWPHFDILIVPTQVQGPEAAGQIAKAIKMCGQKKFPFRPEVIVLTRGGGSIEDLWSFNEEVVVRAIHACSIPIISAVGHEIDVTLSDLAADARALTPSEAGEIMAPEKEEVVGFLNSSALRLRNAAQNFVHHRKCQLQSTANRTALRQPLSLLRNLALQIDTLDTKLVQQSQRRFEVTRQMLDRCFDRLSMTLKNSVPQARGRLQQLLANPVIKSPLNQIENRRLKLHTIREKLDHAMGRKIQSTQHSLGHVQEMLNAFNPKNILSRGYSLTVDSAGKPVVDCESVDSGDKIVTWLRQGKINSTVDSTSPDSSFEQNGQEKD